MSGLENVLGNVYGDPDDQPQKSDLTDVQESMDALVEGNAPEVDDGVVAEDTEADDTAIDDLADWIDFQGEDTTEAEPIAFDGGGDDIFSDPGYSFLDDDDSLEDDLLVEGVDQPADTSSDDGAVFVEDQDLPDDSWLPNEVDAPAGVEASEPTVDDTDAEPEVDAPSSRVGWLDAIDEDVDADWIDGLPEGAAEVEDEPTEPEAAEPELSEPEAAEEPPTDDDDLEVEDEQWLDDLFTADGATPEHNPLDFDPDDHGPESLADIEPILESVDEIEAVNSPTEAELFEPPAHVVELGDETDTAAVPLALHPEPTVEPSVPAAQPAYFSADWIRSDDDILPARGRGKRKAGRNQLQLETPGTPADPITMFAPAEVAEEAPKRGFKRKPKPQSEITPVPVPASETESAPEQQVASTEVIASPEPEQPTALALVEPPVIEDAGLPEDPGEVDSYFAFDEAEESAEADKPQKRKRFRLR